MKMKWAPEWAQKSRAEDEEHLCAKEMELSEVTGQPSTDLDECLKLYLQSVATLVVSEMPTSFCCGVLAKAKAD